MEGLIMVPLAVIVSTTGGVLAALAGVLVGGPAGAKRSQVQLWFRDQQVRACADILRGSTKVLLEFQRASRKHRK